MIAQLDSRPRNRIHYAWYPPTASQGSQKSLEPHTYAHKPCEIEFLSCESTSPFGPSCRAHVGDEPRAGS